MATSAVENGVAWFMVPPFTAATTGDAAKAFVPKHTAKCFCSRVAFTVSNDPSSCDLSHRAASCRLHASPSVVVAAFSKDTVQFSSSAADHLRFYNAETDTVYAAESAGERTLPCRLQCGHCGTWIGEEDARSFTTFPPLFNFDVGADGVVPTAFEPRRRVFAGSGDPPRLPGLPSFVDAGTTPTSVQDFVNFIAPPLDGLHYKGQAGRICVLGGSIDYAGAPYYAGMSALRTGAELLYLCTAEEATIPIKGYSPELMVSEVYRWSHISDKVTQAAEQDRMVAKMVASVLPRVHSLVIGPGLGRDDAVLGAVATVIERCKEKGTPCVIDADGLWLVTQRPALVKGYRQCVLTPNKMEFQRLCAALQATGRCPADAELTLEDVVTALDGPIVIEKGPVDRIAGFLPPETTDGLWGPTILECAVQGAPRRPGGLGDFLAGSLGTMLAWATAATKRRDTAAVSGEPDGGRTDTMMLMHACVASCTLVRDACRMAYAENKRAMVAPDVLAHLPEALERICPAPKL